MGTSMLAIGLSYLVNSNKLSCTAKAALITFPSISSLGLTLALSYRRYNLIVKPFNLNDFQSLSMSLLQVGSAIFFASVGTVLICLSPALTVHFPLGSVDIIRPAMTCWDKIPTLVYFCLLGVFYIPVLVLTSTFHIRIWNIRNGLHEAVKTVIGSKTIVHQMALLAYELLVN